MPDFLDIPPLEGRSCLITDDGGLTSHHLTLALARCGWNVVLMRLPEVIASGNVHRGDLPENVTKLRLENLSETHLAQQVTLLSKRFGPVGMFIHMNPVQKSPKADMPIAFLDIEKKLLKFVFLMAKHLKSALTSPVSAGRSSFMTVTYLGGTLGVGGDTTTNVIAGGFCGLVKTLNLEWPTVFCRALDISPALNVDQRVQAILAELHDPNRCIVDVGIGPSGRVTLQA